jgi:protein LTV1
MSLAEKLKLSLSNHVTDSPEVDESGNPKLDESGQYKVPKDEEEQDGFADDVIRRCKEYGEQYEVQDDDKDVVIFEESSDESEIWDCETIVSTYSNLDNHPGKIETPGFTRKKKLTETVTAAFSSSNPIISLSGKAKLPADFLPGSRKPAAEKVKDVSTVKTEQYKRKQHGLESKEEKKERKVIVLLGLLILCLEFMMLRLCMLPLSTSF